MYKVIVIGGSAGSFPFVTRLLSKVPGHFNTPIVLCLHRLKHVRHGFVEALNLKSLKKVSEPEDKEFLKSRGVYLAPANYHLLMEAGQTFALSTDEMVKFSRPSIDLSFDSFSSVFRNRMLAVILSGANSDGADGIELAKKRGATVIIQVPSEAPLKTMPEAALKKIPDILQYSIDEIIEHIITSEKK